MSIYFSKVMKAGDKQREFNFRQLSAGNELKYNVDVPDDKGNRITFKMISTGEGSWTTESENLPAWILGTQTLLSDAIKEHIAAIGNK
jgi:hypothetical protein